MDQNNIPEFNQETYEPHVQPAASPEWRRFFRVHPGIKKWLPVIGISILSSLVVVAAAGLFLWANRSRIEQVLLSDTKNQFAPLNNVSPTGADNPGTTAIEPKDLTVTDVVSKVNPSVVSIEVSQTVTTQAVDPFGGLFPGFSIQQPSAPQTRVVGKGTGFFVSSDGYIVTNRHVVDFNTATYKVSTTTGKSYTATLVAKDPVFDLAVLKIQGSGFQAVALGNSDQLQLGQSVVAIGFALGQFQNSISVGVISGLSRSIVAGGLGGGGTEQLDRVIQTDAAINPGNSGGPLINLKGEVIGVNVATASGGQSISFAIPANSVRQVVDSVKRTGTIVRPFVGIQYVPIDEDVKTQLNLPVSYGVLVQQVVAGSPASIAGIRKGDIITVIDGVKLDSSNSFATVIRGKAVGQTISMTVLNDSGVQRTVQLKLIQAPNS